MAIERPELDSLARIAGDSFDTGGQLLDSDFFDTAEEGTPVAVSDTASLTLSEAASAVVEIGVSDTASLSVSDAAAVLLAVGVTDTASLAVTESASVEQIDGSLETAEPISGGYLAEYRRQQARKRVKFTPEDEAELAELLREKIARDDAEPPEARELRRIRALVAAYASDGQAEFLSRRGQRAVEYAQRAQTELALQLAAREIERFEDDAITAVLVIALVD